jgi:hypothetical protein
MRAIGLTGLAHDTNQITSGYAFALFDIDRGEV